MLMVPSNMAALTRAYLVTLKKVEWTGKDIKLAPGETLLISSMISLRPGWLQPIP
jgi:hypothetical protein